MIIECPSCQTTYELPVSLPAEGRKVRCESCRHVWLAVPEDPTRDEAPEPADADWAEGGFADAGRPDDDRSAGSGYATAEGYRDEDRFVDPLADFAGADTVAADAEAETYPDAGSRRDPAALGSDAADGFDDFAAIVDFDAIDERSEPGARGPAAAEHRSAIAPMSPHEAAPETDDELMFLDTNPPADALGQIDQPSAPPRPAAPPPPASPPRPQPQPIPPSKPVNPVLQSEEVAARVPKIVMIIGGLSLGVAVVLGLMVVLRDGIVEYAPGAANIYRSMGLAVTPRGLEFDQLSYRWQSDNGQNVLEVRGDVINITRSPLLVPTVVFALRDDKGAVLFHWAADVRKEPLQAGERAGFVTRIPSPPEAVRSVQLHFAKK